MLKQRIITAMVLLVLSGWALFGASVPVWQGLILLVTFIAAWEWSQFVRLDKTIHKSAYALAVTLLVALSVIYQFQAWLGVLMLFQLAVVLWSVTRFQRSAGAAIQLGFAPLNLAVGAVFIAAFALALIDLRDSFSAWILLFSMALIWLMDTGAYFAGRRFGRHKLALHVSPGKTWEGVFGGLVLVALVSSVVWFVWPFAQIEGADSLPQPGLGVFVLMATLIAGLSVYGDLFESLLKRQVGLKDSGKILPGHGGVLDRVDSLIIALPMFWVFWSIL